MDSRSALKHQSILEAATSVFLTKGYAGTSMDDIAKLAAVSKQTVYKHFADKDTLFAEIVLATTDDVDGIIGAAAEFHTVVNGGGGGEGSGAGDGSGVEAGAGAGAGGLEEGLARLARSFVRTLTQDRVLRLRRLIIANADQFPELGADWYERGFERVLAGLADTFRQLDAEGRLTVPDPKLAAHHFAGLLLWIPVNAAMFHGSAQHTDADLDRYAEEGVRVFLAAYRGKGGDGAGDRG
ncbi:TetR/AcrR family transcriptional regulator [Streptomyces sp. NPDC046203]|uniref:TetR/AcrR family transcriptional regulator n=1 Tax=Streptomyces sp. NPDC046203 TaxID=3154602 RepID=UPI0033F111C8